MQTKNTPTALKFWIFFCEFFLALYNCKKCYGLGEAGPARICKKSFGKQLKTIKKCSQLFYDFQDNLQKSSFFQTEIFVFGLCGFCDNL